MKLEKPKFIKISEKDARYCFRKAAWHVFSKVGKVELFFSVREIPAKASPDKQDARMCDLFFKDENNSLYQYLGTRKL